MLSDKEYIIFGQIQFGFNHPSATSMSVQKNKLRFCASDRGNLPIVTVSCKILYVIL